ncbi:transcription antitermination factor NusB [uncultured Alistipes sp.]|uniref:transcription antitermination protein NusB n=1 Tax=uncultured Alistipes sp. TaxID=538949 RepID=UPI0026704A5E|nr:transcription antitermination factor NusB [uncultured Alistipes sp.]
MLSRRLLRIKVVKALYAHIKSESDNMMTSEKNLLASIDKAYDLYFQMLALPAEIVRYAKSRIELNRQKKLPTYEDLNPNTKFVDNAVLRVLANSDSVNDRLAARKLGWSQQPDLIRTLYNQLIESDFYKEYMTRSERSFTDDRLFVENFFRFLQDNEALDTALEELSILWNDDLGFVLAMILRTLSNLRPSHTELKVMPQFKNDDDLAFAKTLFERSLVNYAANLEYVDRFTSNWDVERIVFMDNLILTTAMTELVSFPDIPVKVTLDEFIDISKYYSTPGSSVFINGVLDKMVESLTAEGRIAKSGRGLLDTKNA